jgi:hypothetical protein
MTLGLLYWILMLLWLVFALWWTWPLSPNPAHANNAFLFLLFLLLGWAVFGAPIR